MKFKLIKDEWFPVFTISSISSFAFGKQIELEEEEYNKYKEIFERFDEVQEELKMLYEQF